MIAGKSLQELLPLSLMSTPCVSIQENNKVWCGAAMLIHCLESFTDSLAVTNGNSPKGIVGGKEIILGINEDPSSNFFDNKMISQIMDKNMVQITKETSLTSLLDKWKQTGRAFAVIPNQLGIYSAISARSILEIGIRCKTEMKISDLPKKDVVTFEKTNTIKDIIDLMLKYKTRRLLLKDTNQFISDRIIIEKIARDLNYLRDLDGFLEMSIRDFNLESAKVIEDDMLLPRVYDIMFSSLHPYLVYDNQVISPWDLCMILLSEEIS